MIRIMVVEDETIERNSIISILNENIKDEIEIEGFSNGKEALDAFRTSHFDILLVDINIPYINGLELLTEVKSSNTTVNCIILTSYNRFDYALEAIKLGIGDYLLKPIQPQSLVAAIEASISAIKSKTQQIKVSSQSNTDFIRQRLDLEFSRYVLHSVSDDELIKQAETSGVVLNSMISIIFNRVYNEKNEEKIQEFLNSISAYYVSRDYGKLTTIIFIFDKENIDLKVYNDFCDLVSGGLSRLHTENYSNTINEAVDAYVLSHGSLFIIKPTIDVNLLVKQLIENRDNFSQEELYDISEIISFKLFHLDDASLTLFLQSLRRKLYEEALLVNPNMVLPYTIKTKHYFNVNTRFAEIHANLFQIIKMNLDALNEGGISMDNRHSVKALEYIEKNFRKNITLNDLADYLQVTPQYVSKIMSEHTSGSFIEILNETRIKEALKLLETTMSIKEISYEIGYRSNTYFGRVFKKQVGVTPSQYRDRLHISEEK